MKTEGAQKISQTLNNESNNFEESEPKSEDQDLPSTIDQRGSIPIDLSSSWAQFERDDPEELKSFYPSSTALTPKPDLDESNSVKTPEPTPPSNTQRAFAIMSSLPIFDLSERRTKRGW
jgi:hypothetical protein